MLTVGDNAGTITRTYDELGRLKTQTDVYGLTLTYGYDDLDRLTSITDSLGGTQQNLYTDSEHLTERTYSDANFQLRVDYQYSATSAVTDIKRYADLAGNTLVSETVLGLDNADKPLSLTEKNGAGTTIDSFSYQYDTTAKVTQETSTLGPTRNYSYDPTNQLTADGTSSWSFDANGNRTMAGYATGAGNLYSTGNGYSFSYDDAGNMVTKAKTGEYWTYSYDNNNRLVDVKKFNQSGGTLLLEVKFAYDALGSRIEKDVDANGSGTFTVTKFAVDPNGNAWADLASDSSLTIRRIYADATDALVARLDVVNGLAWYLTDRLGSVRDIVSSSGALIDHLDYDSFGAVTTETLPGNGDRYSWTARERDKEIGLQFNRARYFDIGVGRWTSYDPLGFGAGDADFLRYVGNNATNGTDPSGLDIILLVKAPQSGKGNHWGHAALLVGNNTTGWEYRSWSVDHTVIRDSGDKLQKDSKSPVVRVGELTEKHFQNLTSALGVEDGYYNKLIWFNTSPTEDKAALAYAQENYDNTLRSTADKTEFRAVGNNCSDFCWVCLLAGGVPVTKGQKLLDDVTDGLPGIQRLALTGMRWQNWSAGRLDLEITLRVAQVTDPLEMFNKNTSCDKVRLYGSLKAKGRSIDGEVTVVMPPGGTKPLPEAERKEGSLKEVIAEYDGKK